MTFELNVIANSMVEPGGMSGGNKIFIELVKRWMQKGGDVNIFTSEAGKETCESNGLESANFSSWSTSRYSRFGVIFLYFLGIVRGILAAFMMPARRKKLVIFSTSDFWPDVIPGLLMKRKRPDSLWVSSFQLFMPPPFSKDSPYTWKSLAGLLYYYSQRLSYYLVKKYADIVLVFGAYDIEKFLTDKRGREKVIAIGGGVDTGLFLSSPEPEKKIYDAAFMGRLHPQKGVRELIDIWKMVCEKKKDAKLAIIGHGPLEKEIKEKIIKNRLEDRIVLFGFKDGINKIRILKMSRVMLYPATLDHWSISPIEGMICGLPLVTFDLPSLRFYSTANGMLRVPPFKLRKFADSILQLLEDKDLHTRLQTEAVEWAKGWDWDRKAEEIFKRIEGGLTEA
jgi:glycosyltransferase involved in cell wall biosynthesis